MTKQKLKAPRYGVAEWYGTLISDLTPSQRSARAQKASQGYKQADMPCPFRKDSEGPALCNKQGGVCSLRLHHQEPDGKVIAKNQLVTLCPSRFWEDDAIFQWIGQSVLGIKRPILIKEVPFLDSIFGEKGARESSRSKSTGSVGRIDLVLIDPENHENWCALEIQAVYFSGDSMGSHLAQYKTSKLDDLAFPDASRRPDFRSSGPKRLMPQLQIKVPTLRRWGKRMTVVIDKPFYDALGEMDKIEHLSNADIAWFVVDYDKENGKIKLLETVFTTLESSVDALTAGVPLAQEKFEEKLTNILESNRKDQRKKVIRLDK